MQRTEAVFMAKAFLGLNAAALGDQKITGSLAWTHHQVAHFYLGHAYVTLIRRFGRAIQTRARDQIYSCGSTRILEESRCTPLTDCKAEVSFVWSHCDLGRALFSGAMKRIASESVDTVEKVSMTQLVSVASIAEAHIALVLKDAASKLQFLAGVDEITKRTVKIKYRGIGFEHCCSCPLDQIEYAVRVWLRAKGASAGTLTELSGESLYVSTESLNPECKVPEKLLSKTNRVRQHVATLLSKQAEEDQDGDKTRCRFPTETHAPIHHRRHAFRLSMIFVVFLNASTINSCSWA
eukprot:3417990-Amphidinium_carterae.5